MRATVHWLVRAPRKSRRSIPQNTLVIPDNAVYFYLEMIKLGITNLGKHKLRSALTALGIILGVAAVIVVVAVGEGEKLEALAQIERLGAKNIILRSQLPPQNSAAAQSSQRSWVTRYGLSRSDMRQLEEHLPGAEHIVPLKDIGSQILRNERRQTSQAVGTVPEYKDVAGLRIARGRYLTEADIESGDMVAVIGSEVARQMFPYEDPLGESLQIDQKVVRVIGVLEPVGLAAGRGTALVGRDINLDVHVPISAAENVFGDLVVRRGSGSSQREIVHYAEIYISAPTRGSVVMFANVAQRVIDANHSSADVSMFVPYTLLEEARRDALQKNLMIGAVAGISLLVGGVGIMNIMLATVTERTREIGIRRALGATRRHVQVQFLIETGTLSIIGGLVGVGSGVTISMLANVLAPHAHRLPWVTEQISMRTSVTTWSIAVSLGAAALTGLVFGIYPAQRAAKQDPIVALRHD